MNNARIKGIKRAILTMMISGVAVFANGLVVKGMDPLVHTTVKNSLVGLMVLMALVVSKGWGEFKNISRTNWLRLVMIALVGGSVSFVMFFTGLKMIGGAEGAMIHKTLVVWVALLAIPLLKEKASWKMGLGIILLYGSNFLGGFGGFSQLQPGHVLVLGATLLWAVENVVAKKVLQEVSANVVVAVRMGLGSAILMGMLIASGKASLMLELTNIQWLMLLGVAGLLFGYVMSWYRALQLAPVTVVAGVLVGATVVTNVLNGLLIEKAFSLTELGRAGLIASGIWLLITTGYQSLKEKSKQELAVS